jgi:hypothetical protein
VQLYRYFVSQSIEFCHHNSLCCFSTSVCCCLFRYRLSPETFGYTLVYDDDDDDDNDDRPDIIIKNKTDKICLLADVAIPSDSNVIQNEAEENLKHKNLSTGIQRMWNMKRFVIPVITGPWEL